MGNAPVQPAVTQSQTSSPLTATSPSSASPTDQQSPDTAAAPQRSATAELLRQACPVVHLRNVVNLPDSAKAACPVASKTLVSDTTAQTPALTTPTPSEAAEPPDTERRHRAIAPTPHILSSNTDTSVALPDDAHELDPEFGELTPVGAIPAGGHGNSSDGQHWVNPSANSLYRALHRKGKTIPAKDSLSVSAVHSAVTSGTWDAIMEYENTHKSTCSQPTLARFYGMDGIYSIKAKFLHNVLGGPLPFDRHDWVVDRCGTEVKYIIDYYSVESIDPVSGEEEIAYTIDARPAPTVSGMAERVQMGVRKWWNGENWW